MFARSLQGFGIVNYILSNVLSPPVLSLFLYFLYNFLPFSSFSNPNYWIHLHACIMIFDPSSST